jgi:hypothetical protein
MLRACLMALGLVCAGLFGATGCGDGSAQCVGRERVLVGPVQVRTGHYSFEDLRCVQLVTGTLSIEAKDSDSLDALASLIQVQGDLEILGAHDLSPLSNLAEIDGSLVLTLNGKLQSLHGLEGLSVLGQSLILTDNATLTDLSALGGLQEIYGDVNIERNAALKDLKMLGDAAAIRGSLSVKGNAALRSTTGLHLASIGRSLAIGSNPALTTIDELPTYLGVPKSAVTTTSGWDYAAGLQSECGTYEIDIVDNKVLHEIKAPVALLGQGGCLRVWSNPALTTLELTQALVPPVLDEVNISDAPKLQTLKLYGGLTGGSVRGDLTISKTGLLTLDDLAHLVNVGCVLDISSNPKLADFPFDFLTVSGGAFIRDNPKLPACAVEAFQKRLASVQGLVSTCNEQLSVTHAPVAVMNTGNDTSATCH